MKRATDPVRLKLHAAVKAVERRNRAAAETILGQFGVRTTASLLPEQMRPALDAFETALRMVEAGAAKVEP